MIIFGCFLPFQGCCEEEFGCENLSFKMCYTNRTYEAAGQPLKGAVMSRDLGHVPKKFPILTASCDAVPRLPLAWSTGLNDRR